MINFNRKGNVDEEDYDYDFSDENYEEEIMEEVPENVNS